MNRKQKKLLVIILTVLLLSSCSTHDAVKIRPFKKHTRTLQQKNDIETINSGIKEKNMVKKQPTKVKSWERLSDEQKN